MFATKVLPLAIAFSFCETAVAFDRLAADETAAAYRTGKPDEISLTVPADIQRHLAAKPEEGLARLVQHLVAGTGDDFQKAKRIHDWITDNIAYDSDLLLGLSDQGSRKVADLVKIKRTTCGGYAGLFQQMATLAGLTAETIRGNSKTCWIKSSGRDCHHVWNAVQIRGKWYHVDTTADGRFTYKHRAFTPKKNYRDGYLFIHADAKLLINLPLEERQQFRNPPISRAQYLGTPRVSVLYHKYTIQYTAATIAQFREGKRDFEGGALQKVFDVADSPGEIFELRFTAPAHVAFFPQLVREPGEAFDDSADAEKHEAKSDLNAHAFCYREGSGDVVCQYSAASPGKYKAYLSAKEAGDLHKFGLIHAFTLNAAKAGPLLPQTTAQLYTGPLFAHQNFRITASDLTGASGFPFIEVAHPPENFITSFAFGADGKRVPASAEYSFFSRDRIRFYYKFPAAGTYWVRLQTRIPNESGASLQNTAVARLEISAATDQKFPPANAWIFTRAFAEENLAFAASNLGAAGGDLTLSVTGVVGKNLECLLYNASGKPLPQSCSVAMSDAQTAVFTFRPAGAGKFSGRIFLREGGKKKVLGFFRLERP